MPDSSYAQKPYSTHARKECDPNRIAAIARLYGIEAASPDCCSVLELGCGNGGNLIPLAERYPGSTFCGVDIDSGHIDTARNVSESLGLRNIDWICSDLREYSIPRAENDYIIVHGLYSWVSDDRRSKIFSLCKRGLSPHGVALISYNTLPGWRQRGAVRDIMQIGARLAGGLDPDERLESARGLLKLVASARAGVSDLYGNYIQESVSRLQASSADYLFHEYLEEHNDPCLFADFMQRAAREELQYLAEAKVSLMHWDDLGSDVASVMRQLAHDVVAQEQVLDLCRNRMFRETLLCHSSETLKRELKSSAFEKLFFRTHQRAVRKQEGGGRVFLDIRSGREIVAPEGIAAAVLQQVGASGPFGSTPSAVFDQLRSSACQDVPEADVTSALVSLWRGGFIEAACHGSVGRRESLGGVAAFEFSRRCAEAGALAPSLRHEVVELSDVERDVLVECRGNLEVEELVDAVVARGKSRSDVETAYERLLQLGFFLS